ncbi:MAG: choice-of-anchor Q domain-containing protein [Polyangiaceae bacterium]
MRKGCLLLATLVAAACGSSSSKEGGGAPDGSASDGSGSSSGGSSSGGGPSDDGGGGTSDATSLGNPDVQVPPIPSSLACTLPFGAVDTSTPTTVVGQGGQACNEASLAAAVAKGGIITFDCGGPVTITITSTLTLPTSGNTTIDGGGTVTLDGGGTTRILSFNGGGYRTTSTVITLQNLAFQNGHASGTAIPPASPPCSQGYETDSGGGAVYVVDGVLHVINSTFTGNAGATPGPDVAGGAIYSDGSLGTTIIGSHFTNNTASNGGAVGSLNTDLAIYTSTFSGNTATGTGGNTTASTCSTSSQEIGDGGSGGAVYMDGGSDGDVTFCGDVFEKNGAQTLGGVLFRVYDDATHNVNFEVSTADSNTVTGPLGVTGQGQGGGAFYIENATLNFTNSTISNNSAPSCGGVQTDESTVAFTNVTVAGNAATAVGTPDGGTGGIGGGMCVFSNGGTLNNCTFANNTATGGTSYSAFYGAALFGNGLTINNTIIDENTTDNSEGRMSCGNTFTGARDVQWPEDKVVGGSQDSPCVTGITFTNPMLGPLQNNGGPTSTLAPSAAASVVQIGTGCPATDQTGKTRANPCTIGAVEE